MARKIYKYPVGQIVEAPIVKWLQAHWQNHVPYVWAEVDEDLPTEKWMIANIGTGWPLVDEDETLVDKGVYCGTILRDDDPYVWHIYACKMSVFE